VIAAPPAMTVQWKDELEANFGLSFEIIDRQLRSSIAASAMTLPPVRPFP
jgi:hypothetical protein